MRLLPEVQFCKPWKADEAQVDHSAQEVDTDDPLLLVFARLGWTTRATASLVCKGWHKKMQQPRLTALNLNACQKVSHAEVSRIASHHAHLQRLELYWNVNVRNETLFAVAGCSELKHLNLSGCSHITDDGLKVLASCCTMLTTLDLTRCLKVTDAGYEATARHCTRLVELRMYACNIITDRTLIALGSKLHMLRVVDICGANSVTDVVEAVFIAL
ncbi:hypothetical protein WJX73_006171 [Symbiochloris irregularis]|uniref:F-box/LRR-repeat protein 15-like leucin rich repeat domain-containing protein n=1 Tax=Symbiochloris irregularis TaxID=706552 RepID=A0AAW1PTU9_9CHLO